MVSHQGTNDWGEDAHADCTAGRPFDSGGMIRALLIGAVLVLAPVSTLAQTLTVTNAEGRVTSFTPETLAALPQGEATLGGRTV